MHPSSQKVTDELADPNVLPTDWLNQAEVHIAYFYIVTLADLFKCIPALPRCL